MPASQPQDLSQERRKPRWHNASRPAKPSIIAAGMAVSDLVQKASPSTTAMASRHAAPESCITNGKHRREVTKAQLAA